MSKKIMALVIALCLIFVAFTACTSPDKTEPTKAPEKEETEKPQETKEAEETQEVEEVISGEIEFFTYRDDLVSSSYPMWIEQFNEKYPEITVELSTVKDFDNALRVKLASGDVPDVFTNEGVRYSDAQRAEYMLPLDESFPELVGSWIGNDANKNTDDEKTYSLTFGLQGMGLAYNKVIFEELGLTVPSTFDEMIAAAKKIKESGIIGFTGCLAPQWTMIPYSDTAQVRMADQEKTLNEMTESDAPFAADNEYVQMMELVAVIRDADVWEEDPLSYDWETYLRDFGSGKIGMAFTWTNIPVNYPGRGDGTLALEDIGFVPFPYDNSGEYKVKFAPDWALAIAKNSENMAAAQAFFGWHMGEFYGTYAQETASVSANKDVVVDIPYLTELDATAHEKVVMAKYPEKFKSILDKAQIDFYHQFVEVAAGKSPEEEAQAMNDAWKKAREIVE